MTNTMTKSITLNCGDIVYVELPTTSGSVQHGMRPCIVLGNESCLKFSPVIQVVPLTSKSKMRYLPPHVPITSGGLQKASTALCEQIISIDREIVLHKVGQLEPMELNAVKSAVIAQLSL